MILGEAKIILLSICFVLVEALSSLFTAKVDFVTAIGMAQMVGQASHVVGCALCLSKCVGTLGANNECLRRRMEQILREKRQLPERPRIWLLMNYHDRVPAKLIDHGLKQ